MGFEKLIDSLFDVPLNMLKNVVSWAMKTFGFEEEAAAVDAFNFDISGGFVKVFEAVQGLIGDVWDAVVEAFKSVGTSIKSAASKGWDYLSSFGGMITDEDREIGKSRQRGKQRHGRERAEAAATESKTAPTGDSKASLEDYAVDPSRGKFTDPESGLTFLDEEDFEFAKEQVAFKNKHAETSRMPAGWEKLSKKDQDLLLDKGGPDRDDRSRQGRNLRRIRNKQKRGAIAKYQAATGDRWIGTPALQKLADPRSNAAGAMDEYQAAQQRDRDAAGQAASVIAQTNNIGGSSPPPAFIPIPQTTQTDPGLASHNADF